MCKKDVPIDKGTGFIIPKSASGKYYSKPSNLVKKNGNGFGDFFLAGIRESLARKEIEEKYKKEKELEKKVAQNTSKMNHLEEENKDLSTLFLEMPDDNIRMMNFMVRRMVDQGVEKYGKYERNMFMDIMYQLYSNGDFAKKFMSFNQGTPLSTLRKIAAIRANIGYGLINTYTSCKKVEDNEALDLE